MLVFAFPFLVMTALFLAVCPALRCFPLPQLPRGNEGAPAPVNEGAANQENEGAPAPADEGVTVQENEGAAAPELAPDPQPEQEVPEQLPTGEDDSLSFDKSLLGDCEFGGLLRAFVVDDNGPAIPIEREC